MCIRDSDGTAAPVLIDLDGDGVEITDSNFDFDNDGVQESGGFTSTDDAVLAIDLNNDGEVNGVEEIALADLTDDEDTDLEALATLIDENGDGLVDANDSGFDNLLLWQDVNQDGIAQGGEVSTLEEEGIESIAVEYFEGSEAYEVDGLANILGESVATFTDGTTTTAADAQLIYTEVDEAIDFSVLEATVADELDDLDIALATSNSQPANQAASPEAPRESEVAATEAEEMSQVDTSDDWLI